MLYANSKLNAIFYFYAEIIVSYPYILDEPSRFQFVTTDELYTT